jgi:hypothetical protein
MKCQRLGIPFDNTISPRAVNTRIQKCIESLIQSHVPLDIIHSIKNTDPAPYPDIVQMSDGKDIQSALCGRQYEVSMLQYRCYTCSCCGITCPTHSDPFFKSQPDDALHSAHLNMAFHMAWECNCISGVCKKQQFYGVKRPSIIACYTTLHNGLSPMMEVIGCTSPNALLCNTCYYEFKQLENSRNNLSSGKFSLLVIIIGSISIFYSTTSTNLVNFSFVSNLRPRTSGTYVFCEEWLWWTNNFAYFTKEQFASPTNAKGL